MSSYIDKKFINMVSPQLEKFSWKKDNLAACRCPICGDSTKNKNKTRGYFYIKNNDFFYKCHNCGVGYNLYNFLKEVSPSMCKEYSLERYRNGEIGKSNYKKPEEKDLFKFQLLTLDGNMDRKTLIVWEETPKKGQYRQLIEFAIKQGWLDTWFYIHLENYKTEVQRLQKWLLE